jgi:hypothetical protein
VAGLSHLHCISLCCAHACRLLQRTAGEHERLFQEYKAKKDDFSKRNKGGFIKGLMIPGLAIAQTTLFISQFSAVQTLSKDKVRCNGCYIELKGWCAFLSFLFSYGGCVLLVLVSFE